MDFRSLFLAAILAFTPLTQAQVQDESKKLKTVIDEYTQAQKNLDPFLADYFSIEDKLDQFGDYPSEAYYKRSQAIVKNGLDKIKTVNPDKLSEAEKVEYRLFKNDMETSIRFFDFPILKYLDFNQMGNRLNSYIDQATPSISSFPFDSVKHYDAFVKRSEGFPNYVDNQIAMLKKGIENKITQSCVVIERAANAYKAGLESNPEKNPFYAPTKVFPKSISKKEQARLREAFKSMITTRIVPGFKKFDAFFQGEYKEHCRKEYGTGAMPNAKAMYAYAIRSQTDTDMDAKQIHEIGEKEVARIESEMDEVQKQLGFKGNHQAFLHSLLKEDKFFFKDEKELVKGFERIRSEVKKAVPQYFSLIPRTDFKIVRSANPEDAAGVYHEPTDMTPMGRFVYNATQIRQIPKYEVATLLMHETVPGHHMQLALTYEMKDHLSEYRRKLCGSSAFVEGWALYSEYLGREMGIYKDPLLRLGNLNAELLRAVRLVVDTGIHAMGWSHDETVKYMKAHLATDLSDIEIEANRYSVWPGQALAYKIGQLKIIELRKRAEQELGSNFNVRDFHKAVIGSGTLSLPVLEQQVEAYIKSAKGPVKAASAG